MITLKHANHYSRRQAGSQSPPEMPCTDSKHDHGPWPFKGILDIAPCETICGYCPKRSPPKVWPTRHRLRDHVKFHLRQPPLKGQVVIKLMKKGRPLYVICWEFKERRTDSLTVSFDHALTRLLLNRNSHLSSHPFLRSRQERLCHCRHDQSQSIQLSRSILQWQDEIT